MLALLLGWLKRTTRPLVPALLPDRALVPRFVRGDRVVASPIFARLLWRRPPPPVLDRSVLARNPDCSRNLSLVISLPRGRAVGTAALCAMRAG
jgi:hypothetical protein